MGPSISAPTIASSSWRAPRGGAFCHLSFPLGEFSLAATRLLLDLAVQAAKWVFGSDCRPTLRLITGLACPAWILARSLVLSLAVQNCAATARGSIWRATKARCAGSRTRFSFEIDERRAGRTVVFPEPLAADLHSLDSTFTRGVSSLQRCSSASSRSRLGGHRGDARRSSPR